MLFGEKKRVLIVDDERNVADTLAAIFAVHGYDCQVAYSAEEAVRIVARWEPALAIIDVILRATSGIDLAILLRAEQPSIQVLLTSGQFLTGTMLEEAAHHGHSFQILAKPVPVPQMLEAAAQRLAPQLDPH